MKKLRVPCLLLFACLMLGQTGCFTLIDKKIKDARYKEALNLENTGKFYMKEGEFDSALDCYNRCLPLYLYLANRPNTRSKDSLYCSKLSDVYSHLGWLYDTLHVMDLSLQNELEAVKWSYWAHDKPNVTADLNYNVGWIYKNMGDKKGKETPEGKEFYQKGIRYALASCWEYDSANCASNNTLSAYSQVIEMYKVLGDSLREHFYMKKYSDMDILLNPAEPGKEKEQSKNSEHRKQTPLQESIFDSIIPNSTMQTNEFKNGHYESTSVTIQNGVETIVTTVNGVVVKRETKKLQ